MNRARYIGDPKAENQMLSNALDLFGDRHRTQILDSLFCFLHNEGQSLRGNTEQHDSTWLARRIWSELRGGGMAGQFDSAPVEERNEALRIAHVCMAAIPALCERIAQRYIDAAAAVKTFEELERTRRNRG